MKPVECPFEAEVLEAVLHSHWPDPELRAHAAGCAICSDVAAIAGSIENSRAELRACAVVPDSGRVWWLAQRRARMEAARTASRPIAAAQAIAVACAICALIVCLPFVSAWFQAFLERFATGSGEAISVLAGHGVLVLGVAAVLFLVPAAFYVAMGRE